MRQNVYSSAWLFSRGGGEADLIPRKI